MDFTSTEKKPPQNKTGTLYHRQMYASHGSVRFVPKKRSLRQVFGAGLTSVSLALFIYSYAPTLNSEVALKVENQSPKLETVAPEPQNNEFWVVIPSIGAKSNIVLNVDPANEDEYLNALGEGVAQAKGTGLPGQGKRIFLFAHSTNSPLFIEKYNAIFYDLDKLQTGEKIDIQNGKKIYQYEVFDKKIVSASDTSWIMPKNGEELILQTCWPKGTNWKRLLVIAKPK